MFLLAFRAGGDCKNRADLCGSGGAEGDRTPDLMSAIHALSQLSYSPSQRQQRKVLVKRTRQPAPEVGQAIAGSCSRTSRSRSFTSNGLPM